MIKLYFYIVIFMILWKLSNAKLIEQLKKLAYYDSLSGIKNKEKFRKRFYVYFKELLSR